MARHRVSRRFKDLAQLVLGLGVPTLLIVGVVFLFQRRESRQRRESSAALYLAISNAVVSHVSPPKEFRLAPFVQLQFHQVGDEVSYSGWYEVGPASARSWFRVVIADPGPPPKLSNIEFFPEKPPIRF